MPRKTKETETQAKTKKTTKKATTTAKKTTVAKKESTSSAKKKATSTTVKKSTTTKRKTASSTVKKASTTKKKTASTAVKKTTAGKKTTTTKKNVVSTATKENNSTRVLPKYSPEYYDLPYRYNQTIVKILAQTPTMLFVYWDISDEDRERLKNQFGEYFFHITKPVLIIINETMDYSFEVDINDFANSWYLHINDSNCQYRVELGRRPIPINYSYMPEYDVNKNGPINPVLDPYIYISSSNEIISPNDRILFNLKNKIYFRNIKTNEIIEKDISEFPSIFSNNFINTYELYNDEILKNPSSGNPSSGNVILKYN